MGFKVFANPNHSTDSLVESSMDSPGVVINSSLFGKQELWVAFGSLPVAPLGLCHFFSRFIPEDKPLPKQHLERLATSCWMEQGASPADVAFQALCFPCI